MTKISSSVDILHYLFLPSNFFISLHLPSKPSSSPPKPHFLPLILLSSSPMAPKRAVAKRPYKEPERERRTKARDEVPSSSSTPQPSLSAKFANKVIAKCKCLKLTFLEQEGFTFGEKIKTLGLDTFCSLELPIYPNLIKEFLSVAVHVKSGFKGTIRGVEITLTPTTISSYLNIPREGNVAYGAEPREEALNAVLDIDDSNPAAIITANELDIEPHLLLNIVHRILFPKSGALEYVSERDLDVMYHIIDEIPFDYPKMFMNYLSEAIGQSRMNLPYGMAFTKIFLESGLRISSHEPKESLKPSDYYTISTLVRMGFRKEAGKWIKKAPSHVPHPPSSPPSGPSSSTPQPQRTPTYQSPHPLPDFPTPPSHRADSSSIQEIKDLIASLSDSFSSQLQTISEQNHELRDEVLALKTENSNLKATLSTQVSELTNEVLSLRYTHSQLRDQLNSHINEVQGQFHSLHQKLDSLHSSSSDVSTTSLAPPLSDETIGKIVHALGDSLHDTLTRLTSHVDAVYKHVDDNSLLTRKMQKKLQERATKLEEAIHTIQAFVEEEKHYDVRGIAKETGTLRSKIDSALHDFESLLAQFSDRQHNQIRDLFLSMKHMCEVLYRP